MLYIFLIHWFADFCLQTDEQARMKSRSDEKLFDHVSMYSICWFIASLIVLEDAVKSAIFAGITFLTHYGTDRVTSKISKKFFDKNDYHNGFVVIGFDQMIHYFQLIATFKFVGALD